MRKTPLLCALLLLFVSIVTATYDYKLKIHDGIINGVVDVASNVRAFRGIPFGETTGGSNRFMPPVPKKPWTGTLNTQEFGPGCIASGEGANIPPKVSEDCLTLNVFTPLNYTGQSEGKKLPVMVWIYGGGFAQGSGDGPFGLYDGSYVASSQEVVVVTFNYRLAGLGFLVTDEVKGNMGLLDQQLALHWVQDNIAFFDGNPREVTLFGESAGAMSTGLHTIIPSSKGLFKRAILQSNPLGIHYVSNYAMSLFGFEACRLSGCLIQAPETFVPGKCNTKCMQTLDLDTVKTNLATAIGNLTIYAQANAQYPLDGILGYKPVIDGLLVPSQVIDAYEKGAYNQELDIIVGSTSDESIPFVYASEKFQNLTYNAFASAVTILFGNVNGPRVYKYYYPTYNQDGMAAASRAVTDWWFRCAVQKLVTNVKKYTSKNAYVYKYAHVFSVPELWTEFDFPKQCETAVCHATELPFTFGAFEKKTPRIDVKMNAAEIELSKKMVTYWANFAKTGNPNSGNALLSEEVMSLLSPRMREMVKELDSAVSGSSLPEWHQWDPVARNNIVFETGDLYNEDSKELCEMWDDIGYHYKLFGQFMGLLSEISKQ